MDIQDANKRFRRTVRGFYAYLGSMAAAGVLPIAGMKLIDTGTMAGRIAGTTLATAGWVPMMVFIAFVIRAGDEFQRRLHLVALAWSFAATMILLSLAAALVRAGFIDDPDLMILWLLAALCWLISIFAVKRYYERAGQES